MAKLFTVIKREYLTRVKTAWFIIVTLFGPIFFGAIMILPGYLSVKGMKEARVSALTIVDATGTGLGARVAERLAVPSLTSASDEGKTARVEVVSMADLPTIEETLLGSVQRREINGVLVLDSATLTNGRARYFGRDAGSVGQIDAIEGVTRAALVSSRLERAGLDPESANELAALRVRVSAEKVTDEGRGGSGLAATFFGLGVTF